MSERPATIRAGMLVTLAMLCAAPVAECRTWLVPGEAPTIQAGVDSAAVGDTVLVAPGTYTGQGNRDIELRGKDVVLRSAAGAAATIIDCEYQGGRRAFIIHSGESRAARIEGFTITRAWSGGGTGHFGGGALIYSSSPTFANCVFVRNVIGGSPGDPGTRAEAAACGFGSAIMMESSSAQLIDCRFVGNVEGCGSSAVHALECPDVVMTGCVIADNCTGIGVQASESGLTLSDCTIANNAHQGSLSIGLYLWSSNVTMDRCISWGHYEDIQVGLGVLDIGCADIDSIRINGGTVTQHGPVLSVDPQFCDPSECVFPPLPVVIGNYRLSGDSPCLPENNPCGVLIGALPGPCDATPVPAGNGSDAAMLTAVPNPFRTSTTFQLASPLNARGTLSIFDATGRLVRTLRVDAGSSTVTWDGDDARALRVSPGVYFAKIVAQGEERLARVTLYR